MIPKYMIETMPLEQSQVLDGEFRPTPFFLVPGRVYLTILRLDEDRESAEFYHSVDMQDYHKAIDLVRLTIFRQMFRKGLLDG